MTGSSHRLHNVIRDAIAPDVAKGSGQTPRNDGVSSRQQSGQEPGGITDHQQDSPNVRRVVGKESGRAFDEGGLWREDLQAVHNLPISGYGQGGTKIQ
jgi:hypothetical protein